jgi:uncharacterized protein (TIGR02757 family)
VTGARRRHGLPPGEQRLARTAVPTALAARLEDLYRGFDHADSATDPVHIVRRYQSPEDREIVGFCAAALAFGRVASVIQSIERLLAVLGPQPAAFVRTFDNARDAGAFEGLGHRWIRSRDLVALIEILQQMVLRSGSVEGFFVDGHEASAADVGAALDSFSTRALALAPARARASKRAPGVCYFFPRPSAGSACKRLNLFLRWMVRKDEVDLGVWTRVSASRLVVPLDTHVIRLGRCLRLTRYVSPGWRMAADITAALRRLDPIDPIRFDFALCHVGMMGACGFGRKQGDTQCPLRGLCRPRARRAR